MNAAEGQGIVPVRFVGVRKRTYFVHRYGDGVMIDVRVGAVGQSQQTCNESDVANEGGDITSMFVLTTRRERMNE